MVNIAFFGSSDFSLPILEKLHDLHKSNLINLRFVVTIEKSRSKLDKNPILRYCQNNQLNIYTSQQKSIINELLKELDFALVASYGAIIKKSQLRKPKHGFLNIHGSFLPKYRGACPIQMAVINQDEFTGINIIKMTPRLDDGDVMDLHYDVINILPSYTAGDLMEILAKNAADILDREFNVIFKPEKWKFYKQSNVNISYCYVSDMHKSKFEITRFDTVRIAHGKIMGANPEPKAFVKLDANNFINILRSNYSNANFSSVTEESFFIVDKKKKKIYLKLSDGYLEIIELQIPGKKVLHSSDFINGSLLSISSMMLLLQ
ncbi:MAG: formyltransferase family protein [Candidatus Dojkabacteria bacterium]|nr:formyltransferase family protein [Candidatus Dojkabacteria bacterium]